VEDDSRYRAGLEALLEHSADFELVDSFPSADAALTALRERETGGRVPGWDLVLMDLDLPGTDGIAATRVVKSLTPAVTVVVLTVFEASHTVLQAICAGADGYLAKRAQPAEILEELRAVMAGGAPLSAGVARTVLELLRRQAGDRAQRGLHGPSRLDLTQREQDVLRCLVGGMSYKQVAHQLDISHDTVRSHVRSVYSKLQVHSVAEAVSRAIREGLV
jgi:DNA-binding NarL/FixJ family response regulator